MVIHIDHIFLIENIIAAIIPTQPSANTKLPIPTVPLMISATAITSIGIQQTIIIQR